jgi:PAS domain S-box-containing protein
MFERFRQGGWSIQAQFLLYSAALLIPALIFSGLMILRSASLERQAMEDDVNGVARTVASALDRELAAITTTLTALASSPALTEGDLKAFYKQAMAARDVSGNDFLLTNRTGKLLLTTRIQWGDDVPADSPIDPKEIIQSGKPQVSNLHRGELPGGVTTFLISVPVTRGNKTIFVLSASIPSQRILEIFHLEELEPGWLAVVTDRTGAVVARSTGPPAEAGSVAARSTGPKEAQAGLWRATDSDGESVLRASTYSRLSGWLVSTSVPELIANRPIVRSWALVATLAVSFGLLSALLAYLFGRRISEPVRALAVRAGELGRGETVAPIESSIPEVRAVGEALVKASETREQMEHSLRESEDRLRVALASAETGAWDWDLVAGVLTWDARMRELWGLAPEDPVSFDVFASALNPLDRDATFAAVERSQDPEANAEYDVEHRVKGARDGAERWVATKGRTQFANGKAVRMSGTARDITESKRWEEHTQLLMREVTHRSKNLLAVIQAMARQTKLASRDVNDFEVRFSGRLQALSASHDLLVQRNWHGVALPELVRSQLAHYLDQHATQITIEGPGLIVTPEAAQNIGLAVHELSTNAAKYGALSVPEGRVAVRWSQANTGGTARLQMSWMETGGPEVVPPSRKGFGQLVTEQLTARALQGTADLKFGAAGVSWKLDIPASHLLAA